MKISAIITTALSLAAVSFLSCTRAQAEPESGDVTVAVGDVQLVAEDGTATPLKKGDKVAVGSTVRTGAQSRAVIVITPRSAIRVSENTEVVIETINENSKPVDVMINLKDGSLGALIKPNAAGELDFKVRTPSGVAAARGTFYAVVVREGKGYAQVKEGQVEITPADEEGDGNQ